MRYTFKKEERIHSRKEIDALFAEGKSIVVYPFKLIYKNTNATEGPSSKVLITVSKRNFKLAVTRNRIKRQIREAYRKNKHILQEHYNESQEKQLLLGIVYIGKTIIVSSELDRKLILILHRLIDKDV